MIRIPPQFFRFLLIHLFLCAGILRADPTQASRSALIEQTSQFLEQGDLMSAVPWLEEVIVRFADSEIEEERKLVATCRYFLGVAHLQLYVRTGDEGELAKSREGLTAYLENPGDEEYVQAALESRGDVLRVLGEFEAAAVDFERLIREYGRFLAPEDLAKINRKYGETLYALKDWARGQPVFEFLITNGGTADNRSFGASALVEGLVASGRITEVVEYLPLLVRFRVLEENLSLNVALIEASDALADQKEFGDSAMILSLVRTGEEVVERLGEIRAERQAEIERLKRVGGSAANRIPEIEREIETLDAKIKAFSEVPSFAADVEIRKAKNFFLASRDYEAFWAYQNLVADYPDHPNREDFLYAAFSLAMQTGQRDRAEVIGKELQASGSSFAKEAMFGELTTLFEREDWEALRPAVAAFIDAYPTDPYTIQAIYILGALHLDLGDPEAMNADFLKLEERIPDVAGVDGILYWLGLSHVFMGELEPARAVFERLIEGFPSSGYLADARYRYAVAHYADPAPGLQEEARILFERFVADFPSEPIRGEVEFFLGEIAASNADLNLALEHYGRVPEYTTNMSYITSSYLQRAKLFEENRQYRRMAATLQEYIDTYGKQGDLSLAVLELGRSFSLQNRPSEMLNTYINAVKTYGDDREMTSIDDIIDSYYSEYYSQKKTLEATQSFFVRLSSDGEFRNQFLSSAGFRFQFIVIDNPQIDRSVYELFRTNDGLLRQIRETPQVLGDFIRRYDEQLTAFPGDLPEKTLLDLYREARAEGRRTLALRLFRVLSEKGVAVDNPMILDESILPIASPAVALWVAGRERESDPRFAERIYETVVKTFDPGPWTKEALVGHGLLLMEEQNYEGALVKLDRAIEEFPAEADIYEAIGLKGDILLELNRFEAAREVYAQILQTPDWRGEAHAKALLRTGIAFFEEGRYSPAHGYFERTFIGYPSYPEIAARAYYLDAQALEKLNQLDDARRTLDEMLANEAFFETEAYPQAREMRVRL